MHLMPIGRLAIRDRLGTFHHGRRFGTGERRIDVWRQRDPTEEAVVLGRGGARAHPEALPADETTDEATAVGRVP